MARDPRVERRRRSHSRSDSAGELLPPRTRGPTVKAVRPPGPTSPSQTRRSSTRLPSNSYAERHRAAFSSSSSGSGSRGPKKYAGDGGNLRGQVPTDRHDRVAKRKQHRRRTTLDHNHYREPSRDFDEKNGNYGVRSRSRRRSSHTERSPAAKSKGRRRKWIIILVIVGIILLILVVAIPVGVVVGRRKSDSTSTSDSDSRTQPSNASLSGISQSSIPEAARGTYLDPFTWYDTTDFNLTYTDVTVGGLPIMGLNSSWNDDVQPNSNVAKLTSEFQYGKSVIQGINIGGWFSLEPFITPSFFNAANGIVDEYTLCRSLGDQAPSTLEKHYASFANRDTFRAIAEAGFDHVRIPYSYWAVETYPGDPYVRRISFRYLLRAIEYARQNGLRINLDLHGAPGSQNGWPHSGRQGSIGWLMGNDGQLNGDRTLDIHRQLTSFFAQPRYKNVVTMYGLVNEPRMAVIDRDTVLNWTTNAIAILRGSGMPQRTVAVIGDGFLGLANWKDSSLLKLPNTTTQNLLLDAHQYAIFALDQLSLTHAGKMEYVCDGFAQQTASSMDSQTGFGNFLCGEWSQADTDCTPNLNNAGVGARWDGTLNYVGHRADSVLTPTCPLGNSSCTCEPANAAPETYDGGYKNYLKLFAAAQHRSFSKGWGSFYWTWETENATQWSWRRGTQAGILPAKVTSFQADCTRDVDWPSKGLPEAY